MWAPALTIVMLLSLLAALGYLVFAARRLDVRLDVLLRDQIESRRDLESHVEQVRLELIDEVVVTTSPGC